jgi:hypothetical protein
VYNEKREKLEAEARKTGLKINVKKTKVLRSRNEQISLIKIVNFEIVEVQRVIEKNGGSKADVLTGMSKTQKAIN